MRIQPLLFKAETLWAEQRCYHGRKWCIEADELDLPLYLDLVEVLAGFEGDHIVGRDAGDGFICGILCSVECQCRLTRNHLPRKHQLLRTRSRMGTQIGTYKDFCLLWSKVPLHAGMSICVESNLDDTFRYRLHCLNLISVMSRHRCATKAGCLVDGRQQFFVLL